jgi:RNA polymerase sigma-70 factor (ECF subfamily)
MINADSAGALCLGHCGWREMRDELSLSWSRLYHYVLKRVRDPHLSEDIAQETMSRLVAYRNSKPVENPQALSFSIALNLIRDHFRQQRPTAALDESLLCPQPLADDVVMHRQRLEAVKEVIARMPPLRREVFSRRRLKGESVGEIAASLDMSIAAVEKHLVRGLSDLQAALGKTQGATGKRR